MTSLIISLISGAVGGNAAGKLIKSIDLGTLGNSIAGILGGGLGSQILGYMGIEAGPSGELDLSAIIGSIASGGVGGGVVLAIVSAVKKALLKG